MSENKDKNTLAEEELNKVSGGVSFVVDKTVPDYCTPVEVHDGADHSALCPYDNSTLKISSCYPYFADWLFYCEKCQKWFPKTRDGKWYVSDVDPCDQP